MGFWLGVVLIYIGIQICTREWRRMKAISQLRKNLAEGNMTWEDYQLYNEIRKKHNLP